MSTLTDRMRAYMASHPSYSDGQLAAGFVQTVTKHVLVPLLTDEFRRLDREETRSREAQAAAKLAKSAKPSSPTADQLYDWRPLLDRLYSFDHEKRALRYMTIAEHQVRIDALVTQRNGLDRSITVHKQAIKLIEKAGVTCLDDLDQPASSAAA